MLAKRIYSEYCLYYISLSDHMVKVLKFQFYYIDNPFI